MNPKISVIIPIYNAEKYIDKCIESVVAQTIKDLEIVLIDDESTDKSGQKCDEWAKKDFRIKVLHIKNLGVSNARNVGIREAKGEFIMFVDSDDWIKETMLETLLAKIDNQKTDVVFCDYINVLGNEEINCEKVIDYSVYNDAEVSVVIQNMFGGGKFFSSIWRGIYRRKLIEEKNIRFMKIKFAEDMLFNLEYLLNSSSVEIIEDKLYYYRENQFSALQRLKNNLYEMQKLPYEIFELLKKYKSIERYKNELENEIVLAINRTFDIEYKYTNFVRNIKEFREKYGKILSYDVCDNKIILLCKEKKWKTLYMLLMVKKIMGKFVQA